MKLCRFGIHKWHYPDKVVVGHTSWRVKGGWGATSLRQCVHCGETQRHGWGWDRMYKYDYVRVLQASQKDYQAGWRRVDGIVMHIGNPRTKAILKEKEERGETA